MTKNQLTYWANKEIARSNAAKEAENERHNLATENETQRSNLANEAENVRRHDQQYATEKANAITGGFKNIAQGIWGSKGVLGGQLSAASDILSIL